MFDSMLRLERESDGSAEVAESGDAFNLEASKQGRVDVCTLVASPRRDIVVPAAAVTTSAGAAAAEKPPYPSPAELPTQEGPLGIRFDFNSGCRVHLPSSEQPWRVLLTDLDTGNILFETTLDGGIVNSTKRYYIRFGIEIWSGGTSVFRHEHAPHGRDVLVQFPVGTVGDIVGWLPYAVKFQQRHGCRLSCAMGEKLIALFAGAYPEIVFLTHDEVQPERFYATYSMGLFFDDRDGIFQPCDFRLVGLHRTAGHILGVDPAEVPPRLSYADDSRPIEEPYVCIAAQSTMQGKYWNNPEGWRSIVAFLKEHGFRVICIDEKRTHGTGLVWNHIPWGAEDRTGSQGLQECARWLRHCAFFVGLSSGLSWVAWAAGCPVVMISGFSHPLTEFETPYRVINYHACNSCWNDPRVRFDHKDFLWCPRHKNTSRHYECTRLITVEHVKATIRRIPAFQTHSAARLDDAGLKEASA